MRFHERSFKLWRMKNKRRFIKRKIQLNWGRWEKKIHFIQKKGVFSQDKKNESALEKIKGYQGDIQIHLRKMEVCQIEKNVEWKPIKFQKKKKRGSERERKRERKRAR